MYSHLQIIYGYALGSYNLNVWFYKAKNVTIKHEEKKSKTKEDLFNQQEYIYMISSENANH